MSTPVTARSECEEGNRQTESTDVTDEHAKITVAHHPHTNPDINIATVTSNDTTLRLNSGLEKSLLRAASTTVVMRHCAKVFAHPNGSQKEFETSQHVNSIDVFISHSWRDSRWKKWAALLFHFNFYAATKAAIVITVILLCVKLVVFTIFPASHDLVSFEVSFGNEKYTAMHIQRGNNTAPEEIVNSMIYFPKDNMCGCKEWTDLNSIAGKVLVLEFETCCVSEKFQNLRTLMGKNNTPSAILVYSVMELKVQSSLFIEIWMQYFEAMMCTGCPAEPHYNWKNLPSVFLLNSNVIARDERQSLFQKNINITYKQGITKEKWIDETNTFSGDLLLRLKLEVILQQIPPIVFFILLFFWHHLKPKMLFIDKLCIDQRDETRILEGIQALPAFLHYSRRLVAFWSDTYFTRLWCVYEVARFVATHDVSDFDIQPISLCVFVIGSCLGSWFIMSAMDGLLRMSPTVSVSRSPWALVHQFNLKYWQVTFFVFFMFFVVFLCITFFRDATRAQRLLKKQLMRFSFDDALCTKEDDRVAIEADLSKWFAEGGAAESRASQAVAIAVLAQVQIREKEASKSGPSRKVSISFPWKRKMAASEELEMNVITSPSTTTVRAQDTPSIDHVVHALKQNSHSTKGVYDGLSQDKERRAFELWVRTGVYRDISHYLGIGDSLRFRWIIYSILPPSLNVSLTYVIDPHMPNVGIYQVHFISSMISICFCVIPILYLLTNILLSSKRVKRVVKWIKKSVFKMDIKKAKRAHSFRRDLWSNLLLAALFTIVLVASVVLIMKIFGMISLVDDNFDIKDVASAILLVVMLGGTQFAFHFASKKDSVHDIGLDIDAILDAYEEPLMDVDETTDASITPGSIHSDTD